MEGKWWKTAEQDEQRTTNHTVGQRLPGRDRRLSISATIEGKIVRLDICGRLTFTDSL